MRLCKTFTHPVEYHQSFETALQQQLLGSVGCGYATTATPGECFRSFVAFSPVQIGASPSSIDTNLVNRLRVEVNVCSHKESDLAMQQQYILAERCRNGGRYRSWSREIQHLNYDVTRRIYQCWQQFLTFAFAENFYVGFMRFLKGIFGDKRF